MRRYFQRKLGIYALTFFVAVTVDWVIPRFMPGDPVQTMLARASLRPEANQAMQAYYTEVFGLDVPIWRSTSTSGTRCSTATSGSASGCSRSR